MPQNCVLSSRLDIVEILEESSFVYCSSISLKREVII